VANFFTLELDTTQPHIEVYAPSYTTKDAEMEISVTANETLSDGFQEFYIIDQYGVRHDFIFQYNTNEYVGGLTLSNFDDGIVTFYAKVKDEVNNTSALVSKVIRIIPSLSYLRLNLEDSLSIQGVELSSSVRIPEISSSSMGNGLSLSISNSAILTSIETRENLTSNTTRELSMSTSKI
jgi:hypothetical protein